MDSTYYSTNGDHTGQLHDPRVGVALPVDSSSVTHERRRGGVASGSRPLGVSPGVRLTPEGVRPDGYSEG